MAHQVAAKIEYRGIAQLVEQRSPKPRAEGSNPSAPAIKVFTTSVVCVIINESIRNGPVVQLVRTLACHARGRRFEPVPGRQIKVKGNSEKGKSAAV